MTPNRSQHDRSRRRVYPSPDHHISQIAWQTEPAKDDRVRVLLVGTGKLAVHAANACRAERGLKLIVGTVDSDPEGDLRASYPEIPWLGGLDCLADAVMEHCADEVWVALPIRSCFDQFASLRAATEELGIPIVFRLELFDATNMTRGAPPVIVEFHRHRANRWAMRFAKRAMDLTIASMAVLALSPIFLSAALAIKLSSRGPVLFRQPRVGRGRRTFQMIKFRTMVRDAETRRPELMSKNNARGISFKIFQDPRVTRVGWLLRRSSLDELPQLFNVICGDMSLVGPRPIPSFVAERLDSAKYHRRFTVLPGLTGLWQVRGRVQDFDLMANLDLVYLDTWSLTGDVKILFATIPAVLSGEGAH